MIINDNIKLVLNDLPLSPGVYIMKDSEDTIIYIGKAKFLKKRVSSYFNKKDHDIKTKMLVKNIDKIEFIVTDTEVEALLLENNLIKEHKPKFNIRLKDDKRYPYLAITFSEDYPRIIYTRDIRNKQDKYYGPYTDSGAAKNTQKLINSIFKLKTCTKKLPLKKGERPCLNYQIKKCTGICTGKISKEEYRNIAQNASKFLEGNVDPVLKDLNEKMNFYSENFEYEKAAELRDMIYDIQSISQEQNISVPGGFSRDCISVEFFEDEAILILFEFRNGILLGRKISIFNNIKYSDKADVIRGFIPEHYKNIQIPQQILIPMDIADRKILGQYLSEKKGSKVSIKKAVSKEEKTILNLIIKNIASHAVSRKSNKIHMEKTAGLHELAETINLAEPPEHIVCFDISNFQGTNSVASMAAFVKGKPEKKLYRRFKIRGYSEANDPGMIHEACARFLANVANGEEKIPDLIVIDGGITQLSRAIEARNAIGLNIPVISIAKQFEEIYIDPQTDPIRLSKNSPALKIIQNIRDETHDFGISYHRKLRKKSTLQSELEKINGIGPAKRNILLKEFKNLDNIKKADKQTLTSTKGISSNDAERIVKYFTNT